MQKSSNFPAKFDRFSCKKHQIFFQVWLNFYRKIVKFLCKDYQLFLQKSSHFFAKSIIFFQKSLNFSAIHDQHFIEKSSEFSYENRQNFLAKIVTLFSAYFEQILICQTLCYILVVPVSFLQNSIEFYQVCNHRWRQANIINYFL